MADVVPIPSPEILPMHATQDCSLYLPVVTHPNAAQQSLAPSALASSSRISRFPSLSGDHNLTPESRRLASSPADPQNPSPSFSTTSAGFQGFHPGSYGYRSSVPPPPQEGKGLLSWIYHESAPGKTLAKGFVRLLDFSQEGDTDDDDTDIGETSDDGLYESSRAKQRRKSRTDDAPVSNDDEDDAEDDSIGGLERLVKAAERQAERRQRAREASLSTGRDDHSTNSARNRNKAKFGLEICIHLKSMPGPPNQPDKAASGHGASTAEEGRLDASSANHPSAPLNRTKSAPAPKHTAPSLSSPVLRSMTTKSTAGPVSKRRIVGSKAISALTGADGAKSSPAPTLPGRLLPQPQGKANPTSTTPSSAPSNPPSSSLMAEILKTPRQGSKSAPGGPSSHLPPPKSSPATHMAIAKSVLRNNPNRITLDLAQKLVGKEQIDKIIKEIGLQVDADGVSWAEPLQGVPDTKRGSVDPVSRPSQMGSGMAGRGRTVSSASSRQKGKGPAASTSVPTIPATRGGSTSVAGGPTKSASQTANTLDQSAMPTFGPRIATTTTTTGVTIVKPVCKNCGTTETPRWRVKTLADGKERRVCDACGIYFNKTKQMRPKELWSPSSKRIPLADIPAQEAAAAASRAALLANQKRQQQQQSLSQSSQQGATSGPVRRTPGGAPSTSIHTRSSSIKQAAAPKSHALDISDVSHLQTGTTSTANIPHSPTRTTTTGADPVFTTPRRSTRLSQGGSLKKPRSTTATATAPGEHDEGAAAAPGPMGASPKPRRTPKRVAAAAAASKVKATFEGTSGGGGGSKHHHKQLMNLGKESSSGHRHHHHPSSETVKGEKDGRDRSLTPPPVSEAASRHNEPHFWPAGSGLATTMTNNNATFLEQLASVPDLSDADQADFDLSTFMDLPDDAMDEQQQQQYHHQQTATAAAMSELVGDDEAKFTQQEMDLLLTLVQSEEMMDLEALAGTDVPSETNANADAALHQVAAATSTTTTKSHLKPGDQWDPSSPWSIPTPSGGLAGVLPQGSWENVLGNDDLQVEPQQ